MRQPSARVAIFSNGIPSSTSESFLLTELHFAQGRSGAAIVVVPFAALAGRKAATANLPDGPLPVPVLEPIIPGLPSRRTPSLGGLWNSLLLFRDDLSIPAAPAPKSKSAVLKWLVSVYRTAMLYDWILASCKLLEKYDTLYFYWGDKAALAIPLLRRMFGNLHRIVVRMHGFDLYEERAGGYLPLRNAIFSGADLIAPVSLHGARHLIEKHGVSTSKVVVSRLGVAACEVDGAESPRVARNPGAPLRIVSCANATAIKRLHLIARAMSYVDAEIEWTHIGGGPELENVRRIVEANGKENRVTFTGAVRNKRVLELLQNGDFDFLVSVSRWEGIPVTIMEAMSCGIPAIATDVGGVPEIVDRTNGVLLAPNISAPTLAEVLDSCAELTRDEWEQMSRAAKSMWATRYDADKNYRHFYETILRV